MNKLKEFVSASKANMAIFIATSVLILTVTFGAANAYLTSDTYSSRVQMCDIGIAIIENGIKISYRDYNSEKDGTWDEGTGVLLQNMLAEGEALELGKEYEEVLSIRNTGFINEYVRVSIYKYWLDADGEKCQTLSPELIDLHLLHDRNGYGTGWLLDEQATTVERTVLYYHYLLHSDYDEAGNGGAGNNETMPFADKLTISGELATKMTEQIEQTTGENGVVFTTITYVYDYDGMQFVIEVHTDGVQEHNAEDAILSAWGQHVHIDDSGNLNLW